MKHIPINVYTTVILYFKKTVSHYGDTNVFVYIYEFDFASDNL